MKEMVKEDECFTTIVDEQEYRCRISSRYNLLSRRTYIYLHLEKIVRAKFLWISYYKTEWEHKYQLGSNSIFNREVEYEWISHHMYFEPSEIKPKIPLAIEDYYLEKRNNQNKKIKESRIKHKKVL